MTDPMLDVLVKARRLVARGWAKGHWFSHDRQRVCAMSAIILSGGGNMVQSDWIALPDANELGRETEKFLVGLIPGSYRYGCTCGIHGCHAEVRITRLPEYNDAPNVGLADILALFDKGIAVLEMRETAKREQEAKARQRDRAAMAKQAAEVKTSMAYNVVVGGEKPLVQWHPDWMLVPVEKPVKKWTLASTGAVVVTKIATAAGKQPVRV